MNQTARLLLITGLALASATSYAKQSVEIFALHDSAENQGIGESIGTVELIDSEQGLVIKPKLKGLTTGEHGFHIHENPNCGSAQIKGQWVAGMQAGGHLDPKQTKQHLGPDGEGHLGDLPVLKVDENQVASEAVIAPQLTLKQVQNHSIMIHEHGDNYADTPKPLGGGGKRVACGVIEPPA